MNYNGVYVNNIVYPKADFTTPFLERIKVRVPALRMRAHDLIKSEKISPTFGFMLGGRFHSDSAIVERTLSALTHAGGQTLENQERLDEIILAAYLDAAQADFWYSKQSEKRTYVPHVPHIDIAD